MLRYMHCSLLQVQCICFNKQPVQISLRSRQDVCCNCRTLDPNPIDRFRIYFESFKYLSYLLILKKNHRIASNFGWSCRAQQIFVYVCWTITNIGKSKNQVWNITITDIRVIWFVLGSILPHLYLTKTRYFVKNLMDTTCGHKSNRQRDRALQWRHNSTSNGHHRSATLSQTIKYAESTPSLQFTILFKFWLLLGKWNRKNLTLV